MQIAPIHCIGSSYNQIFDLLYSLQLGELLTNLNTMEDHCKTCGEVLEKSIVHVCEPNHIWQITDNISYNSHCKKTRINRFKWWISTKTFLPGTYKWINLNNNE